MDLLKTPRPPLAETEPRPRVRRRWASIAWAAALVAGWVAAWGALFLSWDRGGAR